MSGRRLVGPVCRPRGNEIAKYVLEMERTCRRQTPSTPIHVLGGFYYATELLCWALTGFFLLQASYRCPADAYRVAV